MIAWVILVRTTRRLAGPNLDFVGEHRESFVAWKWQEHDDQLGMDTFRCDTHSRDSVDVYVHKLVWYGSFTDQLLLPKAFSHGARAETDEHSEHVSL